MLSRLSSRYDKCCDESVWVQFVSLAVANKAVNLGQGFPDYHAPPKHTYTNLAEIAADENALLHQYTRGFGNINLVNNLSKLYSSLIDRSIDPLKEILVTVGAYEALYCAFQGLLNPGDEVVIIEPFFDCYAPMTLSCGGVPRFVPLRPAPGEDGGKASNWKLDEAEFEAAFSDKTKLIVLNTPNNPLGKVFGRQELEFIANICKKYPKVIVISDEVYEFVAYDEPHVRICTLPDMWERTITLGSAGKAFSLTGWKLGWAYGPEELIKCLQVVHQNCVYTCAHPLQEAVARSLSTEIDRMNTDESYFKQLSDSVLPKRNLLAKLLTECGLEPVVPNGGYFMMAKYGKVPFGGYGNDKNRDYQFVKWLTVEHKLALIPVSAFYSKEHAHLGEDYVRFCFIKKDETLDKAGEILRSLK